ncbi:MAG: SGNH family hydrolase [Pseudomonadota bacterium]|nr:SGNH family hydrolase [Pseudomonadota bacterium]
MKRLVPILLALALLSAGVPAPVPWIAAGDAQAQQTGNPQPRVNLLDLIFGGALRKQRAKRKPDEPRARRVIVRPRTGAVAGTPSAPAEVLDKLENAVRVLVVGDFMADGLGAGLEQAYADNPRVVITTSARGLSGLVRDDVIDWPQTVPELVAEHTPVAVIVMVGMNDRQQMRLPDGRVNKLDDSWKAAYRKRIEAIARAVRGKNLPLFWVGLPPVNSSAMNRDYVVFNQFYRDAVEEAGGKFIDVWDGFTNAQGQFVVAGPDVSGQIVRLRNSDGINMTRAGKSKLAFYVERELRRIPGLANAGAVAQLPGLETPAEALAPQYDPATTGRTIVIALDGPMADGGETLEGGEETPEGEEVESATSFQLVVNGVAHAPKKGRIDHDWGAPGGQPEPLSLEALKNASTLVKFVPPPEEPGPAEPGAVEADGPQDGTPVPAE